MKLISLPEAPRLSPDNSQSLPPFAPLDASARVIQPRTNPLSIYTNFPPQSSFSAPLSFTLFQSRTIVATTTADSTNSSQITEIPSSSPLSSHSPLEASDDIQVLPLTHENLNAHDIAMQNEERQNHLRI